MHMYALAILAATITVPVAALAVWNIVARGIRRRSARRSLAAALMFDLAGCCLFLPGCYADDPIVPIINCDAGPAADTYAHCEAPPHGTVYITTEPDGTLTCLWGTCEPDWADCDGNPENGCESSLADVASCGVCGRKCPPETVCGGPLNGEHCVPAP